ncbi:MAG: hypothetical protein LBG92_09115 [Prevotellaceae bacterium]|jgi:hypothetical protein|nr:hypothetical protein [Prevotellaceae bacterium]
MKYTEKLEFYAAKKLEKAHYCTFGSILMNSNRILLLEKIRQLEIM